MAKTLTRIDRELVEVAREQAKKLLEEVFAEARNRGAAGTAEAPPPSARPRSSRSRSRWQAPNLPHRA